MRSHIVLLWFHLMSRQLNSSTRGITGLFQSSIILTSLSFSPFLFYFKFGNFGNYNVVCLLEQIQCFYQGSA